MGPVVHVPSPPWMSDPKRARSRPVRLPLDRAAVLEAAIRVLDRDGSKGLTMRRVADELGVAAASLYGHVANKEELIQLVLDRLFGELPTTFSGDTWQEQLKEFMRTVRRLFLAHPGSAELTMGRVPLGPNFLVHLESLLKIGRAAGLPDRIVAFAGDLLGLYIGAYVFEETMADQAMTPEAVDAMGKWFASLPPAHFPNILALAGIMTAGDSNERFEWGVDVLIRGLGTYAAGAEGDDGPG
jgi:TetR/AcrR family tetracycline transcriptional repressor